LLEEQFEENPASSSSLEKKGVTEGWGGNQLTHSEPVFAKGPAAWANNSNSSGGGEKTIVTSFLFKIVGRTWVGKGLLERSCLGRGGQNG